MSRMAAAGRNWANGNDGRARAAIPEVPAKEKDKKIVYYDENLKIF